MRVRLLKSWRHYRRGFELTPTDGAARTLIRLGIAEPVEQLTEVATMPVENAETATLKRTRKPKRKG